MAKERFLLFTHIAIESDKFCDIDKTAAPRKNDRISWNLKIAAHLIS